jgi:hypothetical protein
MTGAMPGTSRIWWQRGCTSSSPTGVVMTPFIAVQEILQDIPGACRI